MHPLLFFSVVEYHVKAARHGDDELMQRFVRMPPTLGSAGDVVQIVNALDVKRNMASPFDEGEVATRVLDLGKIDYFAVIDTHDGTMLALRIN